MYVHRTLALALMLSTVAAWLSGCNPQDPPPPPPMTGMARFQIATNPTDTFLLDTATGDLWNLDEQPGGETARWRHYAIAPADVKSIDAEAILHPPQPDQGGGEPAEEPHDDQPEEEN